MVAEPIVTSVRSYLRALKEAGLEASFAVVFGSQACGATDRWSDIDVVIVAPALDGGADARTVGLLWRVAARTDSRIEPIPCGTRQWEQDDTSVLLEVARREGVRIAA